MGFWVKNRVAGAKQAQQTHHGRGFTSSTIAADHNTSSARHTDLSNLSDATVPHFDTPSSHALALDPRREPTVTGHDITGNDIADNQHGHMAGADNNLAAQLALGENDMQARTRALKRPTRRLSNELNARLGSEARLAAQGIRLTIGIVWLIIALLLLFQSGQAGTSVNNTSILPPMPTSHAAGLARIFFIAALPACMLAILTALYVFFTRGNNQRVRLAADNLGQAIADQARTLDSTITGLIGQINRDGKAADGLESLTHAQLKAVEANHFFRSLQFLTPDNPQQSHNDLRRFLSSGGGGAPTGLVFITAFIFGALVSWLLFGERPTGPAGPAPDIFQYPAFLMTLIFGGGLFLVAGLICDVFIPTFGATRRRATDDALDAVRGAYTASNAPRRSEMVRRVDDAINAMKTRLQALETDASRGRQQTRMAGTTAQHASQENPPAQDNPAQDNRDWRNRDTSAHFVDAGFQSAPRAFYIDTESPRPPAPQKPREKR